MLFKRAGFSLSRGVPPYEAALLGGRSSGLSVDLAPKFIFCIWPTDVLN
jgi:hypothetical protein